MKLKGTQLKTAFKQHDAISVRHLFDYWMKTEGLANRGTVDWRIHDLKQKNVLQEIKKGWYTFFVKPVYAPAPDKMHIKLDKILRENYRNVRYCIWNTNWLNEFTLHQFSQENPLVEIEKDLQDSLRDLLGQHNYTDVAWSIGNQRMRFSGIKNPIFILPLISRSPLQKTMPDTKRYPIPSLEKILVDIYENESLFYFFQGAELKLIFEHALSQYAINFTTLFGYAKRRNKEESIKVYIKQNFPSLPKIVTE
jgi:hypothetical protein